MKRRQLEYRLNIASSGDAPCEEAVLDSVNGQGIDDLVHPETSGQLSSFLEQSGIAPHSPRKSGPRTVQIPKKARSGDNVQN